MEKVFTVIETTFEGKEVEFEVFTSIHGDGFDIVNAHTGNPYAPSGLDMDEVEWIFEDGFNDSTFQWQPTVFWNNMT